MTLVKFFQTRHTYYTVDGVSRTAWANNTITWYTYIYFGVALVSFVLNSAILFAYCCGVKKANAANKLSGKWHYLLDRVHLVVWIASAAIYRYGKEPVDGKFRDLWGWTCSTKAKELQAVITDVNYEKYCTIQTSSFYSGVANIIGNVLSALIYIFVILRARSKTRLGEAQRTDEAREPLRR